MPIDNILNPNKISRYTPDPIPATIYVASGNYVCNITTPYCYPQVILLNFDAINTYHVIIRDKYVYAIEKRGYCSRLHNGKICYKKYRLYLLTCSIHKIFCYYYGPEILKL